MRCPSKFRHRQVRLSTGGPALSGMTLLEMTVVIIVLLSMITIMFFGVQAWKRGSDRSICIVHIQNVQKGIRSYANIYGYVEGNHVPNLQSQVIGLGKFVEIPPICPSQGTYTYGASFGIETIPPLGELYAECSLKTSHEHEPPSHSDW